MKPSRPEGAKLVVSLFTGDQGLFGKALNRLTARFGAIGLLSEPLQFSCTDYYGKEFGAGLIRKIASFENLQGQEELASIKLFTNGVEEGLSAEGRRRINIDPGFLTLERFVLASCKNYSHRIYLRDGVYADLTLVYEHGSYRPLGWTYPDYGGGAVGALLKEIRKRYALTIGRGLKGEA